MTFCLLGENCLVFDFRTNTPGIANGYSLCEGCLRNSEKQINQLRWDYFDLSQLIPKNEQPSDIKIARPKPESSPPLDMGIFSLRGEIAWFVRVTEIAVRMHAEGRVLPSRPPVREGYELDQGVRFLQVRIQDVAQLPATLAYWRQSSVEREAMDGPAVLVRFGTLHRAARAACGTDEKATALPGECPSCSASSLRSSPSRPERVWCSTCKRSITGTEYMAHVGLTRP